MPRKESVNLNFYYKIMRIDGLIKLGDIVVKNEDCISDKKTTVIKSNGFSNNDRDIIEITVITKDGKELVFGGLRTKAEGKLQRWSSKIHHKYVLYQAPEPDKRGKPIIGPYSFFLKEVMKGRLHGCTAVW